MHKSGAIDAKWMRRLLKNMMECDMMIPDICESRTASENRQANQKPETDKGLSLFNEYC